MSNKLWFILLLSSNACLLIVMQMLNHHLIKFYMPFACVTFFKKKTQLSNIFWKSKDIQVFDIHVKSRDVFRKNTLLHCTNNSKKK